MVSPKSATSVAALSRPGTRRVRCYHCAAAVDVPERAMSLNCPRCSKWLKVEDIVVRSVHHATRVETCGRVFVDKKGWMMAGIVIAGDGIEVLGTLTAREVRTDIVLIRGKGEVQRGPHGRQDPRRTGRGDRRGSLQDRRRGAGPLGHSARLEPAHACGMLAPGVGPCGQRLKNGRVTRSIHRRGECWSKRRTAPRSWR